MTQHNLPTLWGFLHFNYTESESSAGETVPEPPSKTPALTPAEWQYPDDCFYIKMYILAPLERMVEAFGPKHCYGDEKRRREAMA